MKRIILILSTIFLSVFLFAQTEPVQIYNPEANAREDIANAVKQAKAENTQVVFTLDTHEENYMNTREGRFLPVPHCIRNTPGWALEPEIAQTCARGMMSFEKPTFGSTALCEYVCTLAAEKGAVAGKGFHVELCGVCTDICVVSNALLIKASLPEADLTVNGALCAGVTPQKHEAALETMRSCQVEVL